MRMVMNLMNIKVRNGIGQHCVLVNVVSSQKLFQTLQNWAMGSNCGSVGRAVASDTRGPQFESSHRQKIIYILNYC